MVNSGVGMSDIRERRIDGFEEIRERRRDRWVWGGREAVME